MELFSVWVPALSVKQEWLEEEESPDVDFDMLTPKMEPKDEIVVEEHCISLQEGLDTALSCSWAGEMSVHAGSSSADAAPSSPPISVRECDTLIGKSKSYTETAQHDTGNNASHNELSTNIVGSDLSGHSHKCTECGRCFTRGSVLRNHLKIHSGKKDYKCPECGKCFTLNGTLREHLKTHFGEKNHKCAKCGKCFLKGANLREHLKTHTDERNHKCTECGKCFVRSDNLKAHFRIHTGEKNHKCDECGKCFTQSGNLRAHLKIHSGERNHKCDECGKCFYKRSGLRKHLKIHSG